MEEIEVEAYAYNDEMRCIRLCRRAGDGAWQTVTLWALAMLHSAKYDCTSVYIKTQSGRAVKMTRV